MVAFDVVREVPQLECSEVQGLGILFGGSFFGSRLADGRWIGLGVCELSPRVCFPKVKVRMGGAWQVESWDRSMIRPASPGELSVLEYRTDSSAPVFEHGLNHYLGRAQVAESLVPISWGRTCAAAAIEMEPGLGDGPEVAVQAGRAIVTTLDRLTPPS